MAHEIGYVPSRLALYKPARHAKVDPRAAFFANWDRERDNANVDLLCAEMSRLAYADCPTVGESLKRPGFASVDFIGGDGPWARLRYRGTQGFVARNAEGVTILAFRGTESHRFEDVLADLRLRLKPWPGSAARVHAGFRSCYLAVRRRVRALLAATSPEHGGERPRTLFITGHSLGGALAVLSAADLKASGVEIAGVVTFGSPLVGDAGLADLVAGVPVRRYVDCCDLITRVPPERLDRDHVRQLLKDLTSHRWPRDSFEGRVVPRLGRAVSKLFAAGGGTPDYAHVGTLVYANRQGRTSQAARLEDRLVDQDTARREYAQARGDDWVGARDLADHAPINYVSALAGRVEAPPERLYTRDEAIAAEKTFIDERRAVQGQKPLSEDPELRGLCLSGGGIRSATFCLGVLQALAKHGHLARFDYLSTVSGGGYTGTLLTSLLTRTRAAVEREPWRKKTRVGLDDASFPLTRLGADEPDRLAKDTQLHVRNQMHHLRTHSEYLMTHRGLLSRDLLRALGQLGGGIVYTLATYLLLLGITVTLLHLLVVTFDPDLRLLQPGDPVTVANADKLGAAAYVGELAAALWRQRIVTPLSPVVEAALSEWKWCAAAFALGLLWALGWLGWVERRSEELASETPNYTTQRAGWSADDQCEAKVVRQFNFVSVAAMLPFALAALYYTTIGERPTWYAALLLPIAFAIGGLVMMVGAVAVNERFGRHDNSQRDRRRRSVRGAMIGSAWLGLVVAVLVPLLFVTIAALANLPLKLLQAVVMLVGGYLMARKPTKKEGRFGALRIGARPVLTAVTLAFLLVTISGLSQLLLIGYGRLGVLDSMAAVGAFFVFALVLLALGIVVDANRASPHYFYRDRLTEAYLQTVSPVDRGDGGKAQGRPVMLLRNDEDLLLRDAGIVEDEHGRRQQGPYHLLVTALNLRGSDELNRRSFLSDHFIFSRGFVGSSITGFARTDQYDGGQLRLARPMAISAAAVGSAAGFHTFWAQAFFATLFNARLGYWTENPWWGARHDLLGKRDRKAIFWPAYLIRELSGKSHARKRLINLSDGGHTGDNLGLMPLIERGCETIVVCDAEADERRGFGSLMNAIRLAEVELGVDIDIDLGPIQRSKEQPEGYELSEAAVVVGSIKYRSGKVGSLMYLKAAAARHAYRDRGPLPVHVAAYLRENPNFPHQTTIDQFFDDAQFESYRALGFQIADAAAGDLFPSRPAAAPPAPEPPAGIRVEVQTPKY